MFWAVFVYLFPNMNESTVISGDIIVWESVFITEY